MNSTIESDSNRTFKEKLKAWMKQHPLVSFFLLAYAISWVISVPYILGEWGVLHGDFKIVFVVKSFGPMIAAFIMTRLLEGKEGIKNLRGRVRQVKESWKWYLAVLLGIPALLMIGVLVQPGTTAGFKGLSPVVLAGYPFYFIAVFFGGGPLGEEPGWRGFALPRLQERFDPLVGTLVLSLLWTCWHLPDFLTSAQGGGPGTGLSAFLANFPIFLLLVTSLAILFTWVYNRNHGSIFMALLAHASVNTPQVVLMPLFPAVDTTRLNLAALIGFGITALLVVIFTRGKLGFSPVQA
jgi:membrane protease YdiL (CAAX protease family)